MAVVNDPAAKKAKAMLASRVLECLPVAVITIIPPSTLNVLTQIAVPWVNFA
jgi:hypothetical protein